MVCLELDRTSGADDEFTWTRRGSHRVLVRQVTTGVVAIWDREGPHRVQVRRDWLIEAEDLDADEALGCKTVELELVSRLLVTDGLESALGAADVPGFLDVSP